MVRLPPLLLISDRNERPTYSRRVSGDKAEDVEG